MSQRFIIDCDPGHDDAAALLLAAAHLDVAAVTTVFGNNTLAATTRNALAVLELAGLDWPVYAGASRPLSGIQMEVADVHGVGGLEGVDLPTPSRQTAPGDAADFLIEMASEYRGGLTLVALGPLTNIAIALHREPRLAQWLTAVSLMGGSTTVGNVTPVAEFNIHCDPEAADKVFRAGIPIAMVGLNVTRQVGIRQAHIDQLLATGGHIAAVFAGLFAFYLARSRQVFGLTTASLHDPCALLPFVAPELMDYREAHVAVELDGHHTRGMTVCDLRAVRMDGLQSVRRSEQSNARVAVAARGEEIVQRVVAAILARDICLETRRPQK
jgi:inosine-uridine nucleoside N-ribohydrolase